MSARYKIKEFLILKNKVVSECSNTEYLNDEDLEEVDTWDRETCEEIWKTVENAIYEPTDVNICPWCILNKVIDGKILMCGNCNYGKRHGECKELGSNYSKITNDINNKTGFVSIVELLFPLEDFIQEIVKRVEGEL